MLIEANSKAAGLSVGNFVRSFLGLPERSAWRHSPECSRRNQRSMRSPASRHAVTFRVGHARPQSNGALRCRNSERAAAGGFELPIPSLPLAASAGAAQRKSSAFSERQYGGDSNELLR